MNVVSVFEYALGLGHKGNTKVLNFHLFDMNFINRSCNQTVICQSQF